MNPENASAETPTTTETPAAETNELTTLEGVQFGPLTVDLISTKPRAKKNSAEKTSYFYPKLNTWEGVYNFLVKSVDPEKLAAAIMREIIKPAAAEATSAAMGLDANGEPEFRSARYYEVFLEQFDPVSRRTSGESKRDLQERIANLAPELGQLVQQAQEDPTNEEVRNRLNRLVVELNELNQKVEAKSRPAAKGKSKGKSKDKAAA